MTIVVASSEAEALACVNRASCPGSLPGEDSFPVKTRAVAVVVQAKAPTSKMPAAEFPLYGLVEWTEGRHPVLSHDKFEDYASAIRVWGRTSGNPAELMPEMIWDTLHDALRYHTGLQGFARSKMLELRGGVEGDVPVTGVLLARLMAALSEYASRPTPEAQAALRNRMQRRGETVAEFADALKRDSAAMGDFKPPIAAMVSMFCTGLREEGPRRAARAYRSKTRNSLQSWATIVSKAVEEDENYVQNQLIDGPLARDVVASREASPHRASRSRGAEGRAGRGRRRSLSPKTTWVGDDSRSDSHEGSSQSSDEAVVTRRRGSKRPSQSGRNRAKGRGVSFQEGDRRPAQVLAVQAPVAEVVLPSVQQQLDQLTRMMAGLQAGGSNGGGGRRDYGQQRGYGASVSQQQWQGHRQQPPPQAAAANRWAEQDRPRRGCHRCGSVAHFLKDCPHPDMRGAQQQQPLEGRYNRPLGQQRLPAEGNVPVQGEQQPQRQQQRLPAPQQVLAIQGRAGANPAVQDWVDGPVRDMGGYHRPPRQPFVLNLRGREEGGACLAVSVHHMTAPRTASLAAVGITPGALSCTTPYTESASSVDAGTSGPSSSSSDSEREALHRRFNPAPVHGQCAFEVPDGKRVAAIHKRCKGMAYPAVSFRNVNAASGCTVDIKSGEHTYLPQGLVLDSACESRCIMTRQYAKSLGLLELVRPSQAVFEGLGASGGFDGILPAGVVTLVLCAGTPAATEVRSAVLIVDAPHAKYRMLLGTPWMWNLNLVIFPQLQRGYFQPHQQETGFHSVELITRAPSYAVNCVTVDRRSSYSALYVHPYDVALEAARLNLHGSGHLVATHQSPYPEVTRYEPLGGVEPMHATWPSVPFPRVLDPAWPQGTVDFPDEERPLHNWAGSGVTIEQTEGTRALQRNDATRVRLTRMHRSLHLPFKYAAGQQAFEVIPPSKGLGGRGAGRAAQQVWAGLVG